MMPDDLWVARRERARRWVQAGGDLRGYPALHADDETEETLAAEPTKQTSEKKSKSQVGEQAN
jgi:hypothetical protein